MNWRKDKSLDHILFHSVIESSTIYSMFAVQCLDVLLTRSEVFCQKKRRVVREQIAECEYWFVHVFHNFLLSTSSLIHHSTANCQCYCYELNFLCCLSCLSFICFCLSSSNLDFSSFNLSSFSSLVWIIKVWPLIQNENSVYTLHSFRWKLIFIFIPVPLLPIEELLVFVFVKVVKA